MTRKIKHFALGVLALLLLVAIPSALAEETEDAVEQGGTEEQATPTEDVATMTAPLPLSNTALQALVDQRRDLLRERRETRFDALTSYSTVFTPPWMLVQRQAYRDQRDLMEQLHRAYRDQMRAFHREFRNYYSPWSAPFHNWAERQHLQRQLAQLDREEYQDALMLTEPFALGVPLADLP